MLPWHNTGAPPARQLLWREGCPTAQADKLRQVGKLQTVEDRHHVTITFPGTPEFLRLARLTSADAGSRAGFDYEDIDDLRIAVSELCALIAGTPGGHLTLAFSVEAGGVTVDGRAEPGLLVDNELSRAIVEAVVDEFELSAPDDGATAFHCVKRVAS
jgi:serine/threonine-protein kinase RsbW